MNQDSAINDPLANRPLPQWLINQKEGLCEIQPKEIVMKKSNSLMISSIITGTIILIAFMAFLIYFKRKFREN